MQTLWAGHLARMHRAVEDEPCFTSALSAPGSFLCTRVTWPPASDMPAVAAQLTVSDDLAAAAKKGKAAASRFPDAKIALQGRMAA